MADSWSKIFEVTIGDRAVSGEIYDDDGYKVTTTQKSDDPGSVSGDQSNTVVFPPSAAGTKIEIEAKTLPQLEADLVSDGEFTAEEAKEITGKF